VIEARAKAGLFEEHLDEVRVRGEVRQQALEHDELRDAARVHRREQDLRHAAARDARERLISRVDLCVEGQHDAPRVSRSEQHQGGTDATGNLR
jgi:hypothetical protein